GTSQRNAPSPWLSDSGALTQRSSTNTSVSPSDASTWSSARKGRGWKSPARPKEARNRASRPGTKGRCCAGSIAQPASANGEATPWLISTSSKTTPRAHAGLSHDKSPAPGRGPAPHEKSAPQAEPSSHVPQTTP